MESSSYNRALLPKTYSTYLHHHHLTLASWSSSIWSLKFAPTDLRIKAQSAELGASKMGKRSKQITTMICILILMILYQYNLLSLFNFVFLSVFSIFWGAGAIYVRTAAFRRKKPRSPRNSISRWLAKKKKQLLNLIGTYTDIGGYGKERLFVSTTEIAKGSNGTVIFEGVYQGRKVAVKRLFKARHIVALKEVQHLIASDQHPNIVRLHGVKYDEDYIFLVLERCICSLSDLISLHSDSHQNSDDFARLAIGEPGRTTMKNISLWKSNGYPSAFLLNLMRDMANGLVHLHKLGIFHQDINPQNVMIATGENICAKLSDIGISSSDRSSSSQTATDMYSLGCVFYFCLTRGERPFDHPLEHNNNVRKNRVSFHLLGHMPEAVHLLSRLLHSKPNLRPKAFQVLDHPLFWDSEKRVSFLRDVSDRLKLESRKKRGSKILIALESTARRAFGTRWNIKIEPTLIKDITRLGKHYRYNSVQQLLRVVRNYLNHYYEAPPKIQKLLGTVPEGIDNYFSSRFPNLLMEVYKVIICNCRSEKYFEKYFGVDSAPIV